MSEQFYTAICERCGILFREAPGRCPDCGSDEILVLSACDGELLVLADNPEIKIDQTWWNEEQKRFHRLLRLFLDDLDRLKSIDGTLLSGIKTTEAESEAVALAKRWLTNFPLENYASSLAGIRLRQALNLVTARLRGESGIPDSARLREMVASLSGGAGVPDSLIPNLEAERDARVRLEEAEQARRNTWRELEKAVAVTHDMLALVASIRETWNTRPLSLEQALDASAIPGEVKSPALDAWRSWKKARSVELDGNAALDKMERELAALPDSPERTAFDEAGIELHPVDGVPGIFDVAAALKERIETIQKCADWENDEPKLDDVPVPNTARPSIPEDADLKRHTTENVLSAASPPVAFLFRNAKYWAISGGVLFLASVCIPPLGRWVYGEPESSWRGAFGLFLTVFGPVLAFEWRRHREEIERMRLYSERADKTIGDRLSELERTHSTSGGLAELLVELAKKRSRAKAVSEDSIRIVKETQGFRTTLPDGLSADERCKNAKSLFFKTWEDVLDAVAAAAAREDRKSELARRIAVWRERGETLAALRREVFERLESAVESTRGQITEKREALKTATKLAAGSVDAALSEILSRAEIPAPSTEAARAANEAAARQADAARRAWEAAKAATDATVAKEEEKEKRRTEARIEFARLKERTVPAIRAKLESMQTSPDLTENLAERIDSLVKRLSDWEKRSDPGADGLVGEEQLFAGWKDDFEEIEKEWRQVRRLKSEHFLRQACESLKGGRFNECIDLADQSLVCEPGCESATRLIADARREIDWRENEIADWKTWVSTAVEPLNRGPRESVFQTIVGKISEQRAELQRLSDWRDHEKARSCKQEIERLLNQWTVSFARREERRNLEGTYWDICRNLQAFVEEYGTLRRPVWAIEWERGDELFTNGNPEQAFDSYHRAIRVAQEAVNALEARARTLSAAEEVLKTVKRRRSFLLDKAPAFSEEEFEREVRDESAIILQGRFNEAQNHLLAISRHLEELSETCERLLEECYNKRFANLVLREAGHEAFLYAGVSIQRKIFETEVGDDPEIRAVRSPECPWMPTMPWEQRRFPDPVAFIRIVGDFDEAGSLYGRLWSSAVQWSEQWNESVFLVSSGDDASDRHRGVLVDAMRHLVRLDVPPADPLKKIERELEWFLETSAPRREWAKRRKEWEDILKGPAREVFTSVPSPASAEAENAKACVAEAHSAILSGDYVAAETAFRTAVSHGPELTANGWVVVCRNKREEAAQAGATTDEIEEIDPKFAKGKRKLDESCFDEAIRLFEIANRQYEELKAQTISAHNHASQCLKISKKILFRLNELPTSSAMRWESDSNESFRIRIEKAAEDVRFHYEHQNWKSAIAAFRSLEKAEREINFRKRRSDLEDEYQKLRECRLDSEAEDINNILSSLDKDSFFDVPEAEASDPQSIIQAAEDQIDRFASRLIQSWMERHPEDLHDAESWEDIAQTIERAPLFLMSRQWRISNDERIPWNRTISRRPFARLFCKEYDSGHLEPKIDPKAVLSVFRAPGRERILDCLVEPDDFGINGLNLLVQIAMPPYDREFSKEVSSRMWRHGSVRAIPTMH